MMEYLKRKFSRLETTLEINSYPKYYEENNCLIKENRDGTRYIVKLDENHKEIIVGEYHG